MYKLNTLKISSLGTGYPVFISQERLIQSGELSIFGGNMKLCECGCGQEIVSQPHHKWHGTSRFIPGHNNNGKKHPMLGIKRKGKNNPNWKGGLIKRICENCGKEFFTDRCKIKRGLGNFCSRNCASWIDGRSFEPYPPNFNRQLKDRIRVRDNFICQKCGVPELECNQRLTIHHIDYDKKNCEESNLISLCNSCNSKVNTNREYWKGYFKNAKTDF